MSSPVALLTVILLVAAGVVLLVVLSSRAVIWAKTRRSGSEGVMGSIGLGSAINPAEAVAEEKRRVKRSDDGSGDPDRLES